MKKIVIVYFFLFINLYSFDWKTKSEEIEIDNLIFSIKVLDLRYVEYNSKYRGLLKLNYYENNIIEIETFENIKRKNILKVNKDYREILTFEKNIFLKNLSFAKIKNIEEKVFEYSTPTYSQIENSEEPIFLGRGYSKYGQSGKILYDVNYKNQNFILSENFNIYKDKDVRKFVLFILEVMEKIDCEIYKDYFYCKRGINYDEIE